MVSFFLVGRKLWPGKLSIPIMTVGSSSVVLADIDGDHNLEILASTTNNASGDPNGTYSHRPIYMPGTLDGYPGQW